MRKKKTEEKTTKSSRDVSLIQCVLLKGDFVRFHCSTKSMSPHLMHSIDEIEMRFNRKLNCHHSPPVQLMFIWVRSTENSLRKKKHILTNSVCLLFVSYFFSSVSLPLFSKFVHWSTDKFPFFLFVYFGCIFSVPAQFFSSIIFESRSQWPN